MNVYKYDQQTKEYTGVEVAMLDPLESQQQGKEVYLLPANASFIAPTIKEGFAPVWNGEAWEQVEDNRGKRYWLKSDTFGTPAHEMKELGALPDGAVFTSPEKTLDEIKAEKITALKAERDTKEVEPITYNGNSYDYDDKARERINAAIIALDVQTAQAKATASIDWTTADNQDVKVTADDLRMVISSVAVRSNALHIAYRTAKAEVEQATTVAEVEAITLGV